MRRYRAMKVDDADIAAGLTNASPPPSGSLASINSKHGSDLEFFDDCVSEPVLVLGVDISHLNRRMQFIVCACGTFCFSLLYGYLQELISVQLCNRQLGLFLAMVQFSGYAFLAFFLRRFVYQKQERWRRTQSTASLEKLSSKTLAVPAAMYLGLSLLRAVDLGMTNLAMQYVRDASERSGQRSQVLTLSFRSTTQPRRS